MATTTHSPNGPVAQTDPYSAYRFRPERPPNDSTALFVRAYLAPLLPGLEDEPLLEIGAGDGETMRALKGLGFRRVRGVDLSPYQVAAAAAGGIHIEQGNALDALARQPEESLAAVLALDVLEHLARDEHLECARLTRRALRPDGVFVLRVPNGAGLFGGGVRYDDLTHQTAFTAGSIRDALRLAGFSSVRVAPCRPVVHGTCSAARYAAWRLIEGLLWVANAAESGEVRGAVFTRNLLACGRR